MELMQALYEFGKQVTEAVNNGNVKPLDGKFFGGIVVMAAPADHSLPPLAGTLNYNLEEGKWYWSDQLEQATPVAE